MIESGKSPSHRVRSPDLKLNPDMRLVDDGDRYLQDRLGHWSENSTSFMSRLHISELNFEVISWSFDNVLGNKDLEYIVFTIRILSSII